MGRVVQRFVAFAPLPCCGEGDRKWVYLFACLGLAFEGDVLFVRLRLFHLWGFSYSVAYSEVHVTPPMLRYDSYSHSLVSSREKRVRNFILVMGGHAAEVDEL